MNARGTRRPHSRRVRSKPVRTSRRSGGGGGSKSGCAVFILAFLASPPLLAAVWAVTR